MASWEHTPWLGVLTCEDRGASPGAVTFSSTQGPRAGRPNLGLPQTVPAGLAEGGWKILGPCGSGSGGGGGGPHGTCTIAAHSGLSLGPRAGLPGPRAEVGGQPERPPAWPE